MDASTAEPVDGTRGNTREEAAAVDANTTDSQLSLHSQHAEGADRQEVVARDLSSWIAPRKAFDHVENGLGVNLCSDYAASKTGKKCCSLG